MVSSFLPVLDVSSSLISEMSSILGLLGSCGEPLSYDCSYDLMILLLEGATGGETSTLSLLSSIWTVGITVSDGVLVFNGISPVSSLN